MRPNRIYWVLALAVAAVAVCLGRVTADDDAGQRAFPTAVCSMPDVFQQYVRTQDMLAQLNAVNSSLQTEQNTREAKIKEGQQELGELKAGSEAHTQLADSLETQMIELRIWQETQQARLRRRHQRMTEGLYDTIAKMVAEVAAERGILIVMNHTEMNLTDNVAQQLMQPYVLHADETVDITAEVIRRLNEQYTPAQQPSQ